MMRPLNQTPQIQKYKLTFLSCEPALPVQPHGYDRVSAASRAMMSVCIAPLPVVSKLRDRPQSSHIPTKERWRTASAC